MSINSKIYIVIPAYNESEQIKTLVTKITDLGYQDIVIVDDGSEHPIENYFKQNEKIKILRHKVNRGAGAASQTGIKYALNSEADYVVLMDADGQHQPEDLKGLLEPILSNQYDIAIGSRFVKPNIKSNIPLIKKIALKLGIVFTWFISGVFITDSQNGFKALNRKAAQNMKFLFDRYEFCLEIIDLIKINNLKFCEVPVTVKYTAYSMAKGQKLSNAWSIIYNMLSYKMVRIFFG